MRCSVCGAAVEFQAYNGRKRARCPECLSLERHRALWDHMQCSRLLLRSGECRLLHFSPAQCLVNRLRRVPWIEYVVSGDEDIQQLSYADDSFDAVLCVHVLEHVADDRLALREVGRVLRPGGWAVFIVPIEPGQPPTVELRGHVRAYSADFADRVRDAGFDVRISQKYPSSEMMVEALREEVPMRLEGMDVYPSERSRR